MATGQYLTDNISSVTGDYSIRTDTIHVPAQLFLNCDFEIWR